MATILITGCRSGIGHETALAFGRRGDTVYATMRDPSIDDRLRDAVARESLPVVIRGLDVTDGTAIRDVVAGIVAERGGIDVLVNNAGIGFVEAIEEADEARARLVWETNFWGPIHLCQAVLPYMRAQRAGVIVNLSTFGTRFPGGGWLAMYGATKQAMSRMSESLSAELVGTGVRAVAIEPGMFATEIYGDRRRASLDPASPYAAALAQADERVASGIAKGADPAAVAHAIVAAVDDPTTPARVLVGEDALARWDEFRRALIKQWRAELGNY
jgi:NAD(P)-dependent dehydrogenase (short-subunit alcohol dehydrogenase family)